MKLSMPIRRIGGRRIARVLMVALLVLSVLGVSSMPAAASGTGCTPPWHNADVCVYVSNGKVWGDAYHYSPGYFTDVTVYVRQCRGDLTNCGTIAANHGSYTTYLSTSHKDAAYGHVYKACASWTDNYGYHIVNYCSPWRSWP
jgi:hypothetical protein